VSVVAHRYRRPIEEGERDAPLSRTLLIVETMLDGRVESDWDDAHDRWPTIRLRVGTDVVEHDPVDVAPDPVDPFDAVAVLGRVLFGTVPERDCETSRRGAYCFDRTTVGGFDSPRGTAQC
jgi:hypothetical protein